MDADEQVAVLVDDVKLVQFGQPEADIPSLVRLYILDDLPGPRANTWNRQGLLPPVPPSLPWRAMEDREAPSVARRLLVQHDKLVRKMIKAAAEVLYAVPEDQHGIYIENRRVMPPVKVDASIAKDLASEGPGAEIRDWADDFLQLVSVGFGATELISDTIERWLIAAFPSSHALDNGPRKVMLRAVADICCVGAVGHVSR